MSNVPIVPIKPDPSDPHATSDKPYRPSKASTADFQPDEAAGTMIGPYKLLQMMGKGGMGAVWMAEQMEPVQRRVAVKIIKADLHGDQVLARFEAERQALAMMDHPNIAKVLDAGATAGGRPYFVMELVKGIAFTKYCDQEHLTPKERLELFIPVCNAVQHAHQKGIIHRDLKPSNVLIALYDGKPVPKVIDFGIAKATHQKLTERTIVTEQGPIGTFLYMAPEQAEPNNLDIDTRADIYSLGVMLYEVLTGAPPLSCKELRAAGVPGDAAADPQSGAGQAEHEAVEIGRVARHRRQAQAGAEEADGHGAGRSRLDRDEVPGERARPPVRFGQSTRRGIAAVPL